MKEAQHDGLPVPSSPLLGVYRNIASPNARTLKSPRDVAMILKSGAENKLTVASDSLYTVGKVTIEQREKRQDKSVLLCALKMKRLTCDVLRSMMMLFDQRDMNLQDLHKPNCAMFLTLRKHAAHTRPDQNLTEKLPLDLAWEG